MRSDGTFDPVVLEFSEAAGRMLDSMPQMIKARFWSVGQLPEMEPYLLRLPVLMARTAGVLHRFEGDEGLISVATMRVAAELGFWLAQETSQVLCARKSLQQRTRTTSTYSCTCYVSMFSGAAVRLSPEESSRTWPLDLVSTMPVASGRCMPCVKPTGCRWTAAGVPSSFA